MALPMWLNPLQSYSHYKSDENTYTTRFLTKLKGTFFLFSGNVENPGYDDVLNSLDATEYFEENASSGLLYIDTDDSKNHIGIYDVLTLGIPGFLETLFRGHFSTDPRVQKFCYWFFMFLPPIIPVLAALRYGFGVVATAVAFLPVLAVHLGEWVYSRRKRGQYDIVDDSAVKVIDEKNSSENENINTFNNRYESISGMYKFYKSLEQRGLGENNKKYAYDEAPIWRKQAMDAFQAIPETYLTEGSFFNKKPSKLAKRMEKLAYDNKYGAAAFERFNPGKK